MISLSDSSVAFIGQQGSPYALYVYKVDLSGNLIWAKSLTLPSSFNFTSLAPTTDGGLILTGGGCAGSDMVIHLDADGTLLSQHSHSSFSSQYPFQNVLSIVHDGNNQYSCLGCAAGTNSPIYAPLIFFGWTVRKIFLIIKNFIFLLVAPIRGVWGTDTLQNHQLGDISVLLVLTILFKKIILFCFIWILKTN
ncbi:MAG: hypothetical protein IPP34_11705 [Bacteroidetes bacterium]|nr:hypothetical protein [Bacteroidota bacterium]